MYTYLNPRTGQLVVSKDFSSDIEAFLLANHDDIVIGYSAYSNAVKIYKWNSIEGCSECIHEASLQIVPLNSIR